MVQWSIDRALAYAQGHHDDFLQGFTDLLQFPSISQQPEHRSDIEACADWIVAEMERIGLQNCHKIQTEGHPIVYGDWLNAGDDKPTLLVYAHYDVQPVGPYELWQSPPFEPTEIDGRLVARGTIDDKCGIWVNLKALESILASHGELPINIRLFFEGEEELGSPNVQAFVAKHDKLLQADALIISDGPFSTQQPIIGYAVRGSIIGEVIVKGPQYDLHSGRYGGIVHNPIHHLGSIIASFHDESGRVLIPGFYDGVAPLTPHQRQSLEQVWDAIGDTIQSGAGVSAFWGDDMGSFIERSTSLPTLDISGIYGGYAGEGAKSIIPSQAGFKITIRIVADQDPDQVWELFRRHITTFSRDTVHIDVQLLSASYPFTMSDTGKEIEAIQAAFRSVLGKPALLLRHGGSLPIGGLLQRKLGIPTTMLGFGAGDNAHAPNEYINLSDLQLGIDVAIQFLMQLGK